jgi:hypothetical protein
MLWILSERRMGGGSVESGGSSYRASIVWVWKKVTGKLEFILILRRNYPESSSKADLRSSLFDV